MTREEKQKDLWKKMGVLYHKHWEQYFSKSMFEAPYRELFGGYYQSVTPGIGLSFSMFLLSVENLASEE